MLADSITEPAQRGSGCVVISGSHGGTSSARYALAMRPLLAVFNDAGVGKDDAGIAALALLQAQGIAACTVGHRSARIGDALSSWTDGVLSHCNAAAAALGARAGMPLRQWLLSAAAAGSSPARH